jgi:hypothetical protein
MLGSVGMRFVNGTALVARLMKSAADLGVELPGVIARHAPLSDQGWFAAPW